MNFRKNEHGSVLIIVLITVTLFSILGLSIITTNLNSAKQENQSLSHIQAIDAAEMGMIDYKKKLSTALTSISSNTYNTASDLKKALADAVTSTITQQNIYPQTNSQVSYHVTRSINDQGDKQVWSITSKGTVNGTTKTIVMTKTFTFSGKQLTPLYKGLQLPYVNAAYYSNTDFAFNGKGQINVDGNILATTVAIGKGNSNENDYKNGDGKHNTLSLNISSGHKVYCTSCSGIPNHIPYEKGDHYPTTIDLTTVKNTFNTLTYTSYSSFSNSSNDTNQSDNNNKKNSEKNKNSDSNNSKDQNNNDSNSSEQNNHGASYIVQNNAIYNGGLSIENKNVTFKGNTIIDGDFTIGKDVTLHVEGYLLVQGNLYIEGPQANSLQFNRTVYVEDGFELKGSANKVDHGIDFQQGLVLFNDHQNKQLKENYIIHFGNQQLDTANGGGMKINSILGNVSYK